MSVELARIQLRGMYAIAAGFLLLLGVPLYQAIVLAPSGYIEATDAVVQHGDFGPLLLWTSAHVGAALAFHVLELVPFLLALGLPFALRRVLWRPSGGGGGGGGGGGLPALLSGVVGFACYAVAIAIGIVAGTSAASSYAAALPHNRGAIASGFAGTYAFTTLLSQVIGGALVAIFVALVCLRIIRTHTLLTWIGYLGLLLAALLAITAIQFSAQLTQAATTISPFSFFTLALWLVCIGVQLASLRRLPETGAAGTAGESSRPLSDSSSDDASRNSDGAPNRLQSAGQ